jgi:hypothetical protein
MHVLRGQHIGLSAPRTAPGSSHERIGWQRLFQHGRCRHQQHHLGPFTFRIPKIHSAISAENRADLFICP